MTGSITPSQFSAEDLLVYKVLLTDLVVISFETIILLYASEKWNVPYLKLLDSVGKARFAGIYENVSYGTERLLSAQKSSLHLSLCSDFSV